MLSDSAKKKRDELYPLTVNTLNNFFNQELRKAFDEGSKFGEKEVAGLSSSMILEVKKMYEEREQKLIDALRKVMNTCDKNNHLTDIQLVVRMYDLAEKTLLELGVE